MDLAGRAVCGLPGGRHQHTTCRYAAYVSCTARDALLPRSYRLMQLPGSAETNAAPRRSNIARCAAVQKASSTATWMPIGVEQPPLEYCAKPSVPHANLRGMAGAHCSNSLLLMNSAGHCGGFPYSTCYLSQQTSPVMASWRMACLSIYQNIVAA